MEYRDDGFPASVTLEAFSPFIPLNVADSALPATVMHFTIKNTGKATADVQLAGWLQNAVGGRGDVSGGRRRNRVRETKTHLFLECAAEGPAAEKGARPPVVFADFEGKDYGAWKATGEAFGTGPVRGTLPGQQHVSGYQGEQYVNSWVHGDDALGALTSPEFKIERRYVSFLIGGGNKPGAACINLVLDGKVVRTATGKDNEMLEWRNWDVRDLEGKTAHIEIVDKASGPWGHVNVDQIEFRDEPRGGVLAERPDFGTMGLALLGRQDGDTAAAALPDAHHPPGLFEEHAAHDDEATAPLDGRLRGGLGRRWKLEPGQEATATFVVTWHFPNLSLPGFGKPVGRWYATRFADAAAVAESCRGQFRPPIEANAAVARHVVRFDAALLAAGPAVPEHVDPGDLDRPPLRRRPILRLGGRRLLRRHLHPRLALRPRPGPALPRTGALRPRDAGLRHGLGRLRPRPLPRRNLRRHLRHRRPGRRRPPLLPRTPDVGRRRLSEAQLAEDQEGDGVPDRPRRRPRRRSQGRPAEHARHGLFRPQFGLTSLYLAALRAAEEMAREIGDQAFAKRLRPIFESGSAKVTADLWNGEYFYHKPDPKHPEALKVGDGCFVDQVFGQSWAFQVGLGRILPEDKTRQALQSLWKYNLTPDVGPYRKVYPNGRWYAMPGEGGLIMCTWPKGGREGTAGNVNPGFAAYFNECMNGFEYQAAGHMIWEGLVTEGWPSAGRSTTAITRAAQPLERSRMRRPLRPVDGQLRRLPGGLRLRIPRAEGPSRLRPAAEAGRLPRRLHRGRGLGDARPEARERDAAADGGGALGQGAAGVAGVRRGGGRKADEGERESRR